MQARLTWTVGKILFLYFCGVLLGGNLLLYLQAREAGAATTGPLLGTLLALLLPVLPVAHAFRQAQSLKPECRGAA
jgi:hypothetical protein